MIPVAKQNASGFRAMFTNVPMKPRISLKRAPRYFAIARWILVALNAVLHSETSSRYALVEHAPVLESECRLKFECQPSSNVYKGI